MAQKNNINKSATPVNTDKNYPATFTAADTSTSHGPKPISGNPATSQKRNRKTNTPAEKKYKAKNKAEWKQLLKEMQGHYGKLSEVIMELIDNASSVFEKFNLLNGTIEIIIKKLNAKTLQVIVRDNGAGIQDIHAALSLGKRSSALTALSGHGMGFKNLPVKTIILRTVNQNGEAWEVTGPFIEGVDMDPFDGFTDRETGTELEFTIAAEYLNADIARWGERSTSNGKNRTFFMLCDCVAEHISVVLGKRIEKFQHNITITAYDENDKKKEYEVKPLLLVINPLKLVAEHPELGSTQGIKEVDAFNGDGKITAEYVFGYGAPSRKSKRGYFQNNQVSQGWYISINGRYIGKTATIGVNATHPSLNGLMGWIDLQVDYAEQAPQTEIAKTGFVEASHQYNALLEMIEGLIPGLHEVLRRELKAAKVHDVMRDELHTFLTTNGHVAYKEAEVPGQSKQKVDNLDTTAQILYELKSKVATTRDVFQLYGYVAAYVHNTPNNIPFKTVLLCATGFPDECMGAIADANCLLEPYGFEIEPRHLHEVEGIKTLPSAKKQNG